MSKETIGADQPSALALYFSGDAPPWQRFISSAGCALFGLMAAVAGAIGWPGAGAGLATLSMLSGGGRATFQALRSLRSGSPDINLLMILAAITSAAMGHWDEGAILLFLFSASDALESFAMQRTRGSIQSILGLRPDRASVIRDDQERQIAVDELIPGDVIRVRPGDRLPIDGRVIEGRGAMNEALITGESLPIEKRPGDSVFAGAINCDGSLLVEMTHPAGETTLHRIVRLVEQAQESRGTLHRAIERYQKPYVYGVLAISLGTVLVGWLASGNAAASLHRGMLLLVAASPCAVILATPTAVLATVTRAARLGVLFKGGISIERLARVSAVAFDKTGTLTRGEPTLIRVEPAGGGSNDLLLARAAALEHHSEHPLARAIVRAAAQRGLEMPEIQDFRSESGIGVHARIGPVWLGVGSARLFEQCGAVLPVELREAQRREGGEITVMMACSDGLAGRFVFRDQPRAEAADALRRLRALGIERCVMLTGDRPETAKWVAEHLGLKEYRGALTPEQKLAEIRALAASGHGVAMVGDGVNDAPALAAATVGVAMGGAGTDVAIEAADVVLMRDDLNALADAFELARRSRATIEQSLFIAFGTIGVLIALTLLSWLPLPVAVVCHEGSTLVVVLNGLRLAARRRRTIQARPRPALPADEASLVTTAAQ